MLVARYSVSAALAFGVTFGLFSLMVALIATSDSRINEEPALRITDIIMPDREIKDNVKEQKPEKPKAEEPPPELPQPEFDNPDPAFDALNITPPSTGAGVDVGFGGLSASDGEYLPIVKVAPQYPRRALQRGIEGFVLLEFTVTKQGSVKNPKVIESQPPRIFDRSAIKAAAKFKYKPRVVDGEPIEVPGVRNRITFALDKD
jgi:protein TonB